MSNDRSNEAPQEQVLQRRAGIERRDLLLGGTALLTVTASTDLVNAQTQTPDSIKTRTASCNCGQLRVTTKGPDPDRVVMCNCYLCQKQTGSAFSLQARFPNEQVTIEGKSTAWKFPIEGAKPVTYRTCAGTDGITNSAADVVTSHFCPVCGSTVYYFRKSDPARTGIRVGAFADPTFPPPTFAVYTARRHPWAVMPDLVIEELE